MRYGQRGSSGDLQATLRARVVEALYGLEERSVLSGLDRLSNAEVQSEIDAVRRG